ncbi:MAG: hypothetical protein GY754_36490 [bacterium]|nr:hypothetical protein [bacterium]
MAFSLGEYQDIFLEEADEQLQELNQNLLELEKNPDDEEIINNIFRAAHSLKSSAAFVGLNDLSDLAHKMENLLQGIRDKTMEITSEIVDVIFKCFDEINAVIESVASGEEPTQNLNPIIERILAISEQAEASGPPEPKESDPTGLADNIEVPKAEFGPDDISEIRNGIDTGKGCYEIVIYIEESAQMKWVKVHLVTGNLEKIGTVVRTYPPLEEISEEREVDACKMILVSDSSINAIKKACDVDLIVKIEIKTINLAKKSGKTVIRFNESEVFMVGGEVEKKKQVVAAEPEVEEQENEPVDTIEVEIDEEEISVEVGLEEQDLDEEKVEVVEEVGLDQDRKKAPVLKTVKVSVDKLDQLLNNVAELVIANSGFFRLYEEIRKLTGDKSIVNEFKNRMDQMSMIAKDLQTGIMKTRMVPIGQVFTRYNRLVRDLAKEREKNIELIIKGEDTELDKKVIDVIGEPLLHLIRNGVDHGIETPEERKRLGKSDVAHVTLNAHQGGNQIFVEVSDDGRGLDIEQIKRKVIEKGLTTPEALGSMDSNDIFDFIFAPGFSTAKEITDISGRGVGMNVVKEIVSELNGNVSIETEVGMGTRFVLTFPLTLAIIPAIMVKVTDQMYAIPLSDVIETIKISQLDVTTIEGHEVINLRGEILSLLRLSHFIGERSGLTEKQKIPVVVVGFGNRKIGLIVDQLEGKLEIVIKSLEQNYKTVEGLAGASILGDGSIALILDINSMINKVIAEQDRLTRYEKETVVEVKASSVEKLEDLEDYEAKKIREDVEKPSKPEIHESVVTGREESIIFDREEEKREEPKEAPKKAETPVKQERIERPPVVENVRVVEDEPLKEEFVEKPAVREEAAAPAEKVEPVIKDEIEDEIVEENDIKEEMGTLLDKETTPVAEAGETEVDERVHEALQEFKKELKGNIQTALGTGGPGDHMELSLDISKEDLNEFQTVANVGAANAATSLSQILQKRIDLSIPEISIRPTENIPEYIGNIDSIYIGVILPILGEAKGTLLFILHEDVGFELIETLYGSHKVDKKELDEDGESALKEITNIVGSSLVNVIAEKTELAIKPSVPTIVHDYMQSIIDSILVMHNMSNDYSVVMDTAFFFENDKIIGTLLLLPETESLKNVVGRLRTNVGSN